ncbi:MAG: hypothetical protein RIQ83_2575 [Pseudomonadota bacterium]|jgi:hypothetical protein
MIFSRWLDEKNCYNDKHWYTTPTINPNRIINNRNQRDYWR